MLNGHKETTHKATNSPQFQEMRKRFKCDQCGYTTTTETYLINHKETHHNPKMKVTSKRKKCDICDKKFNKESNYKRHMMIDHKEGQSNNTE